MARPLPTSSRPKPLWQGSGYLSEIRNHGVDMKRTRRSVAVTWLTCLSLMLALLSGIILSNKAGAASDGRSSQGKEARRVSGNLEKRGRGNSASTDTVRVILQLNGKPSSQLNALLNRNGVHVRSLFNQLNAHVVDLPASVVEELAA